LAAGHRPDFVARSALRRGFNRPLPTIGSSGNTPGNISGNISGNIVPQFIECSLCAPPSSPNRENRNRGKNGKAICLLTFANVALTIAVRGSKIQGLQAQPHPGNISGNISGKNSGNKIGNMSAASKQTVQRRWAGLIPCFES